MDDDSPSGQVVGGGGCSVCSRGADAGCPGSVEKNAPRFPNTCGVRPVVLQDAISVLANRIGCCCCCCCRPAGWQLTEHLLPFDAPIAHVVERPRAFCRSSCRRKSPAPRREAFLAAGAVSLEAAAGGLTASKTPSDLGRRTAGACERER